MRRSAYLVALMMALLVALPLPALATPAPTAAPPGAGGEGEPRRTPRPERTPRPTEPPSVAVKIPTPARDYLHIGYSGRGVLAQAPLLVAEQAGYFDDVGLTGVIVVRTGDIIDAVRSGDLDIGAVPSEEAHAAIEDDPSLQIIAGYRNYDYPSGGYRGELLIAAPGVVADEPSTVLAFLNAFLRALQLLGDDEGVQEAYDLVGDTDLVFNMPRDGWAQNMQAYAPFDGGFGSLKDEGGLGELTRHLGESTAGEVDLDGFIADHTLSIAQISLDQVVNPANALAGPPGVVDITVAMAEPDAPGGPITMAMDQGYLADAGFASVELVEADAPLLGVLQGQVEFAVMDTIDVAEATAQGLPLIAIGGHRNYKANGAYGDDVLVASRDLISEEGATVSAFLVAYVRALQELAEQPDTAVYAPYDGGFGDGGVGGGLGEMLDYLGLAAASSVDPARFVALGPLEYAQAWWGLPVNPDLNSAEAGNGEAR